MPSAFITPCKYPGCRRYAVKGTCYCAEHKSKVVSEYSSNFNRASQRERGYTRAWERLRRAFLALNPLCVECQKLGVIKPATDVDHIVPHRGDMNLFWKQGNLQALCHECHSRKTAVEDSNLLKTPRGSLKK